MLTMKALLTVCLSFFFLLHFSKCSPAFTILSPAMTSEIQVFSRASGVWVVQTSAVNLIYILKNVEGKLDRGNLPLLVTHTRLPLH